MPRVRWWERRLSGVALAIACAAVAIGMVGGCKPARKGPATVPVTGVVTLAGTAVAGATVAFQPGEGGRSAAGITDSSGRYELSTYARNDGAIPGEYSVVIVKFDATPTGSPGTAKDYKPPTGEIPPPKNELPAKYADAKTSGLKATVNAGQNSIDFPLSP